MFCVQYRICTKSKNVIPGYDGLQVEDLGFFLFKNKRTKYWCFFKSVISCRLYFCLEKEYFVWYSEFSKVDYV